MKALDKMRIDLIGSLAVFAPDGKSLTPRSAKARGMIALLATSNNMRRSRTWLQSKLWSDRGREQAAASLRQVLTETRKAMGECAKNLIADRMDVALNPNEVKVYKDPAGDDDRDFLEGLEVRDEEFEDWLRVERAKRTRKSTTPAVIAVQGASSSLTPFVLLVNESQTNDGMEKFFSDHFADSVARSLSEILFADVEIGRTAPSNRSTIILRTSANLSQNLAGLRISMEHGNSRKLLWSGSELVQSKGYPPVEHENVLRLVNNAAEGIVEAIHGQDKSDGRGLDAHDLARRAQRLMFSMEKQKHLQADGLFDMAYELEPNGLILAWRAMLRVLMLVEQHDGIDSAVRDEAVEFAARALELDPVNSMVLAAAANTSLVIEGNSEKGYELALRSIRINPSNPFALDAAAMAALYHGDLQKAHRFQLQAKYISGNTQFSHWFDMGCTMTSTRLGDFENGLALAERSAAIAPSFRPPLRYMIALYLKSGDIDKAAQTIERLRAVEPGFVPERLWDDDEYPVRDLRRNAALLRSIKELR